MAEQPTDMNHPTTADDKFEEAQLTNVDLVSASNGYKKENTDIAPYVNPQQPEDTNLTEEKKTGLTEESSPKNEETLSVEDSTQTQAGDEGNDDSTRETERTEQPIDKVESISKFCHSGDMAVEETATKEEEDGVDGPKARDKKKSQDKNIIDIGAEGDVRSSPEKVFAPEEEAAEEEEIKKPQEITTCLQAESQPKTSVDEKTGEQAEKIENVGRTHLGSTESEGTSGGNIRYLILLGVLALVLAVLMQYLHPESPSLKIEEQQIDIFLKQMEKLKTQFSNQRAELWKRSRIHLLRHLQTAQPTEPVSLILTAGVRAERTLHCLAKGLASAFSSSLNASVLYIDGASKASQDSDQVKLDIDRNLQGAFEGDKPVAVIHRFEELPPGSTLIFYRYCDHENAAYKKTFLIFTVLLGEEEEIPAKSHLSAVEEMVDDHLQKKFLSDSYPVSYDRMDLDKYGGLWSRISHLILPVAAEVGIERDGCERT
ncbi:torsin-1A-interacting protein 2-like isoform X2 [Cheilinus undulatus]|uniref:torsin-1A-interacting protein 2-like isoform X2 n=1 Tax=Cheilinus undulatus TaxID=241271 RepID=UPI001BD3497C|nr:torsin-1A-interacting protein 2-like isoform X2 [Cheilinus undulatus]